MQHTWGLGNIQKTPWFPFQVVGWKRWRLTTWRDLPGFFGGWLGVGGDAWDEDLIPISWRYEAPIGMVAYVYIYTYIHTYIYIISLSSLELQRAARARSLASLEEQDHTMPSAVARSDASRWMVTASVPGPDASYGCLVCRY